ncbi:hypothetical protein [Azospirillum doebereinerae]|uniref:Uncharacterized protein n=1 Tax=Azospirillum doebereinerae TaxID=92933 RepID=A0A3S0V357_9PROT|nr:hypothetical protein [Azospirillum doebereinerae]RUQ61998.1 hypothetical protein EJ913_29400 [Azospirillum doebereinerae]
MAVALAQPADHRLALDLEALLVWAIRDQQADRTGAALHPAEAIAHYGLLHGLPAGAGVYRTGISADGCATIANRFEVGADIDGGGAIRGIPPRVHPDAELVAEALEWLPASERRVIQDHARHTDRPVWLPLGAPLVAKMRPGHKPGRYRHVVADVGWEASPKQSEIAQRYFARGVSLFDRLGRRRIVEEERGFQFRVLGDGTRQVLAEWCPLEPKHSAEEIAEANEDYRFWHGAMEALHERLCGKALRDHRLTGFTAPARPWDDSP